MCAPMADTDCITVRRRVCDTANTDRSCGTGHILDQNRLAERDAHTLAHHTFNRTRPAARRGGSFIFPTPKGRWAGRRRALGRSRSSAARLVFLRPPRGPVAGGRVLQVHSVIASMPADLIQRTWARFLTIAVKLATHVSSLRFQLSERAHRAA